MSKAPKKAVCCRHCDTHFLPDERESEFCCAGCRYVFQMIHSSGMEQFYELTSPGQLRRARTPFAAACGRSASFLAAALSSATISATDRPSMCCMA